MASKFDDSSLRDYPTEGEKIAAQRNKKKEEVRGTILPFRKDEEGLHWALPRVITDAIDSFNLPKDVIKGYQPTEEDILNFVGNVGASGVSASALAKPDADSGMFLGTLAKNADENAASKAVEMAGKGASREEIWAETGWFKDPADGHWKFEIDDSKMGFKPGVLDKTNPDMQTTGKAKDMIDHSELFDNYPEGGHYTKPLTPDAALQRFESNDPYNQEGVYSFQHSLTGNEEVFARGKTDEDVRSVTLHELQHAVQSREDFAYGGSPGLLKTWKSEVDDILPPEAKEFITTKRQLDLQLKALDDPKEYGIVGVEDSVHRSIKANSEKLRDLHDKLEPIWDEFEPFVDLMSNDDFTNYKRTAGEVEARNVQTRRNMTMTDRKENMPWDTIDVPEDKIINAEKLNRKYYDLQDAIAKKWKKKANDPNTAFQDAQIITDGNSNNSSPQMSTQNPRIKSVEVDEFKNLLQNKKIRPASLEDVNGTHHQRPLYKHPNTGQYYVEVK